MKIERIYEKNNQYTLLKVENSITPYVVAWKFDGKSWQQGHYFEDKKTAEKFFDEKTGKAWQNFASVLYGNVKSHYA